MSVQSRALVAAASHSGGTGSTGFLVVGVLAILLGAFHLVAPAVSWRYSAHFSRWQFKNAQTLQPSSAALMMTRVGGGVGIIVGIVLLVAAAS